MSWQPHLKLYRLPGVLLGCAAVILLAEASLTTAAPGVPMAQRTNWWSFKPVAQVAIPQPQDVDHWVRNPIDSFVLARLQKEGLSHAPEADRRTLIRRVTFDLIGLPPTPEEIAAFVADPAPDAYEKLVDRLLASPRYGECWARHWLDVVHYGDTHGYDKDKVRPNAWHYRDYVIGAFNQDKPYARFVREQLAGDILFPGDSDALLATGFVAAGPWDIVGHTEISEDTSNGKLACTLDRDDMVMNTMSTFASLTVHCARCHDHKFDAITQQDYYSLQAVFAGVDRTDRKYDADPAVASRRHELTHDRTGTLARLAEIQQTIDKNIPPELASLSQKIAQPIPIAEALVANTEPANANLGYHSALSPTPDATKWVQVDLGSTRPIDAVYLAPVWHDYGGWPGPGWGFPVRYKVEASDDAAFEHDVKLLIDRTHTDVPNPGEVPVGVPAPSGTQARYVRVTATRLWHRSDAWMFALSELMVASNGVNVARGAPVTSLDTIEAPARWGRANLVDGKFGRTSLERLAQGLNASSPSNGYHSLLTDRPDATKWVQIDLGKINVLQRVRIFPARPTDFPDTPGFGFPVRFRVEASADANFATPTVLWDQTAGDFTNPGDHPVDVDAHGVAGRYVRLTATKLWKRTDDYALALAEMDVEAGGQTISRHAQVTALDSIESGRWSRLNLTDGYTSRERIADSGQPAMAAFINGVATATERRQLIAQRETMRESLIPTELLTERRALTARATALESELNALPEQSLFYGISNRYSPPGPDVAPGAGKSKVIRVLHRGNVTDEKEVVGPGAISAIAVLDGRFKTAHDNVEGERRAALADWIVDAKNPLSWRSIVNRVWLYHFGHGIVESPSDFGHMGSLPSHPEMLDWLASEFRDGSQSLKQLHRLIVTSATYRQSSESNAAGEKVDASNRLLWHMNRRRLDAEAIRDSVLTTSGTLDLKMGGPGFFTFNFVDDYSPHYLYEQHDPDDPASLRRTIYRFIVRSVPDPFMTTLDCPDPSLVNDKRFETVTPLQSLEMLNDAFMIRQAQHFADRLAHASPDPAAQLDLAFNLALGRKATTAERDKLLEFEKKNGLPNLCRLILNLNEFVFVD